MKVLPLPLLCLVLLTLSATAQINPQLLLAIQQNNLQAAGAALKARANPNATDSLGATPLMWACYKADTPLVKMLLQAGAKPECRGVIRVDANTYYGNLTGLAAGLNKLPLLRYLVDTLKLSVNEPGYNPDTKKNDGWTPAEWAASQGNADILRYLTERGADLQVGQGNVMILAVAQSQTAIVGFLLEQEIVLNDAHPQFRKVLMAYFTQLFPIAVYFGKQARYKVAALAYEELVGIYANVNKQDKNFASLLHNLASIYYRIAKYDKALTLFLESKAIRERVLNKNHPEYAETLRKLGALYVAIGQYENASLQLLEAKDILDKTKSQNYASYANVLNDLANLYVVTGQQEKAIPLLVEAKDILDKASDQSNITYADILKNLAQIHVITGQYEKALPLLLKAREFLKKGHLKNQPHYGMILGDLAQVYEIMGDMEKVLPLLLEARDIIGQTLTHAHSMYASTLNNIAMFYFRMGDYDKSLSILLKSKALREQFLDKNHPDYVVTLNNLANVYIVLEEYEDALPLLLEAKNIITNAKNTQHPNYTRTLSNLATFYQVKKDYEKALSLMLEVKDIQEKNQSKNHPDYATTLNNLAAIYMIKGEYKIALPLYEQAYTIVENTLGKQHPNYTTILNNLGLLHEYFGQYEKATPLYREAYQLNQQQLINLFGFTSAQQQVNYLKSFGVNFIYGYSFALKHYRQQPELAGWTYNNALFYSGLLLNANQQLNRAVTQSSDATVRQSFQQLQQIKTRLNQQWSLPIEKQVNLPQLQASADSLEQILTRQSQAFRDFRQNALIQWPQIQKKLRPNEAAIEFVTFRYIPKLSNLTKKIADSTLYAAFVLRPGYDQPKLIRLFENRQLIRLLKDTLSRNQKSAQADSINRIYRSGPIGVTSRSEQSQLSNGQKLTQLIWQPLDSLLRGVDTVYFAASGLLHQVAFAALPHPRQQNARLADSLTLRQVLSTRQLAQVGNTSSQLPTQFSAEIFGDIDYTPTTPTSTITQEKSLSEKFPRLLFSAIELDSLQRQLGWPGVHIYRDKKATKQQVKALSGNSVDVLHFSTHTFQLADTLRRPKAKSRLSETTTPLTVADDPLRRTGLAMTGANATGEGRLSALEIADLDLSHTTLVSLAACQTGGGQIHASEGVYGLARGFKLAGARYLVLSLWNIEDQATSQFMSSFYQKLSVSRNVRYSFESTQAEYRKLYPDKPYQWAFVLVE